MTFDQARADELTRTNADQWQAYIYRIPTKELYELGDELAALIDEAAKSPSGVLHLWCVQALQRMQTIMNEWDRRWIVFTTHEATLAGELARIATEYEKKF
ncbi:hypothetical protein FHT44_005079 [Mycolicibacterium sp. BK634]|uniref:hypothetical protein n=1 Tax=Mycolicibacterium sp. BK634 TaxID=2587099 RepID=UPI00162308CF|nr:hypothetical protein [Mycolicibacterium sp. BK634]MBB3752567.1 hypothetical protein [Mycolicibacterium sp. BK634]